jgi:hypothetical protein
LDKQTHAKQGRCEHLGRSAYHEHFCDIHKKNTSDSKFLRFVDTYMLHGMGHIGGLNQVLDHNRGLSVDGILTVQRLRRL